MVLFAILLLSFYYYQSQEKLMLSQERATLSKYAYIQTKKLKVLHHFFDERVDYPRDPHFKSAIYDLEEVQIFTLLEEEDIRFDEEIYKSEKYIHFVKSLDDFYLGAKYLILEVEENGVWKDDVWKNIIGYGLLAFFIFMILGLYLAKLFLKPMRDSIILLDRFIKDTTHENKTKLSRINIAAKTVSVLYKDLMYLTLEQEKENQDEEISIQELIKDRVEYFSILAQSKRLEFTLDLEDVKIKMDRRKLTRVIDNLISNAIKYNKRNGEIGFKLREKMLMVWDTGIGMREENIPLMFDRYLRFNNAEGGFGIGLSIVKKILAEYKISVEVESKEGEGTKMVMKW
jgi:two-component system OmpR family sensor kinase